MTIWTLLVMFSFATLMVAGSFVVIIKKDEGRIWDHLARTMTQLAIGAASVLVAVIIFAQQSRQQDVRQFAQQANLSSAFLRSIVAAVTLDVKELQRLNDSTYQYGCDTVASCNFNSNDTRVYELQLRNIRRAVAGSDARPLFLLDTRYGDQVRELVKTSYVFGPRIIDDLLASAQRYNTYLDRIGRDISRIEPGLQGLIGEAQPSPKLLSEAFLKVAYIQAENVSKAASFVCTMHVIEQSLHSPSFLAKGEPLMSTPIGDNDFTMCDVQGAHEFEQYTKWDRKFRAPR